MQSPFALLEAAARRLFARGEAMDRERSHFEAVAGMCGTDNRWAPIHYLYDRLNIIDAKASSILTVNTISLGISGLVVANDQGGSSSLSSQPAWVFVLAAVAIGFGIGAIVLTLAITRVKFDHIRPGHGQRDYEEQFFEITIARQMILALARMLTMSAFLIFTFLILRSLWRARG